MVAAICQPLTKVTRLAVLLRPESWYPGKPDCQLHWRSLQHPQSARRARTSFSVLQSLQELLESQLMRHNTAIKDCFKPIIAFRIPTFCICLWRCTNSIDMPPPGRGGGGGGYLAGVLLVARVANLTDLGLWLKGHT